MPPPRVYVLCVVRESFPPRFSPSLFLTLFPFYSLPIRALFCVSVLHFSFCISHFKRRVCPTIFASSRDPGRFSFLSIYRDASPSPISSFLTRENDYSFSFCRFISRRILDRSGSPGESNIAPLLTVFLFCVFPLS